jgi:hypothetical protein
MGTTYISLGKLAMRLLLVSSTLGLLGYCAFLLDLRTSSKSSFYGLSLTLIQETHTWCHHKHNVVTLSNFEILFLGIPGGYSKLVVAFPRTQTPPKKIILPWLVSSLGWSHLQNLKRHSFHTPPGCSKFKTVVASPTPPKQILPPSKFSRRKITSS